MSEQQAPPPQPLADERLWATLRQHWKLVAAFGAGLVVAAIVVGIVLIVQAAKAPQESHFVVVSTDWRLAGDTSAAHGVFRNQGGSGSAVVTFSNGHGRACTAVIQAPAGQLVEAQCPLLRVIGSGASPTAQVSS